MSAVELFGRSGKGSFTGDKSLERKACGRLIRTGGTAWHIPSSGVSSCVPSPSSLSGVKKVEAQTEFLRHSKTVSILYGRSCCFSFIKADSEFCYCHETELQGFGSPLSPSTDSLEL